MKLHQELVLLINKYTITMQSKATTVSEYCSQCPVDQAGAFLLLRETIKNNLPNWFEECMNYGMIWYVIPHSLYPAGYHCDPKLPLPFMWLAYQKNSINFYHMGIYADEQLLQRFQSEFPHFSKRKLDMGKSCIRFKWYDDIPYNLIGQLVAKITPSQRISLYEISFKKKLNL